MEPYLLFDVSPAILALWQTVKLKALMVTVDSCHDPRLRTQTQNSGSCETISTVKGRDKQEVANGRHVFQIMIW